MSLKPWIEMYVDNQLVIAKYLYKNKAPFEVFIADLEHNKETTYHVYHDIAWIKTIHKQQPQYKKTNYGFVLMPKLEHKYLIEWYGQDYQIPIKQSKYHFIKNSNQSNIVQSRKNVTYRYP